MFKGIKYYVKEEGKIVGHFYDYEIARDYADKFVSRKTMYVESDSYGVEFMKWND